MRSVPLLLLAASLATSGCYAYIPIAPQEAAPGDAVRFRLTPEEAARYQDLRLANPRLIEGTLVQEGETEMVLDAHVGRAGAAEGSRLLVQEVSIPRAEILEVELRKLDGTKTGLVVAGGIVAIATVVAVSGGGSGSDDGGGTDIPEARRIPLIRFSLPLGGR